LLGGECDPHHVGEAAGALEILREAGERLSGADVARRCGRNPTDGTVRRALGRLESRVAN
jgi:hypothetical protein